MMHTLRRVDDTLGLILHDAAKIMFFLFALVALIICRGYQELAIPHPYSLDYGEAPLVDHAMSLTRGENIYRADISGPPYTITNYPPLYMLLIALSVKLSGPVTAFLAGRMISAFSCWIAAFCIVLIIHTLTRDLLAALTGAFTFLAFPFVVFWSPLLRIDMLALALSLCAITLLVLKPNSTPHLIGTSLLLVAAIYTRQSYALAAPFAAFVWLLRREWRQALRLALYVGGLSVLLFIILNILTDGGFFYNIVTANVNEFRIEQLIWNGKRMWDVARIPLLFGGLSLLLPFISLASKLINRFRDQESNSDHSAGIWRWDPVWTVAAPYLIGSVISAATIGKVGSNVNYLLELCVGLGLAAGVAIAWGRAHLRIHIAQAVVLVPLAFGIGRMMHFMMTEYGQDLRDRRAAVADLYQLEVFVNETPGLILADEYMGMLTLHDRPLTIQPFEVTQMARDGKWDQTPLLESIENKEFAAIILLDQPWSINDRWTPEMVTAITESYRLVDVIANNRIYKASQPMPITSVEACHSAKWRLPTDASLGVQWNDDVLDFFGRGKEINIPVYAVADGTLTRMSDWVDGVAILHEDPTNPSNKVWAFYGGMAAANGTDSYIVDDFPPGVSDVPVKSGQLLGYQGTWSGTPQWPSWKHAFLVVLDTFGSDAFPTNITPSIIMDPAPFLGLRVDRDNKNPQPLKCEGP